MKYSLNSKIITHLTEPQSQKLTWPKLTNQFNFKLDIVWSPIKQNIFLWNSKKKVREGSKKVNEQEFFWAS